MNANPGGIMDYSELDPEHFEKAADVMERVGKYEGALWPLNDRPSGHYPHYAAGSSVCAFGALYVALGEQHRVVDDFGRGTKGRGAGEHLGEYLGVPGRLAAWSDQSTQAEVVGAFREFAQKIRAEQGTLGES